MKKYETYFGKRTYGNEIVSAGFLKSATDMDNGNIDLSSFELNGENVDFGFMGREGMCAHEYFYFQRLLHR